MKHFKKYTAVLLSVLFLFSLLPFGVAAESSVSYIDADGNTQSVNAASVGSSTVSLGGGWYAVSSDVTVSSRIICTGNVNLILADGCTLTASLGISVNAGNTLTVYAQQAGTGKIETGTVDSHYAAIGGDDGYANGLITINGGVITVTGGRDAAGIGGGYQGSGNVTVNGGVINATGGYGAAGIGSGDRSFGGTNPESNVTINGGSVTAVGGDGAAAIGGRCDATVTINGGDINATATRSSSAIGGGNSYSGTVSINGGTVIANGVAYAAAIGGGRNGDGIVTITGGNIQALASDYGIGGGSASPANSTISLKWTSQTDRIYSQKYSGTVTLQNAFTNGTDDIPAGVVTDYTLIDYKTLSPKLGALSNITVSSSGNGTATVPSQAYEGETVTVTVTPQQGESLISLTVKDASNNDITVEDDNSFMMPASNVTVTAVFSDLYVNTAYVDADCEVQQVRAAKLTSDYTTLTEGWYVVNENVTFNGNLKLSGTVNLILGDGATLTVNGKFDYVDSNTMFELNVYGQQMQTGTLNSPSATNIFYSFSVYGGNVNFNSIMGLNINILGGNFTATNSIYAVNDGTFNGVITLGCNTQSSTICAANYIGTVKIADGQTLIDENSVTYSGTLANSSAINGKTLRAYKIYDINEDGYEDINDIAFIISASVGEITMTASQEAKADLNGDGVVDAFDAAELDRIMFSVNTAKGDVNQDGEVNEVDYAMVKSYVECTNDLLSTDYLESRYDTLKTQYPEGTIITQQYYCADYDCDKAVDAFDLFYLDKRINNLI